jgi:hypothetical protein
MLYRLDSHRVKSLMARGQVSWIDQILVLISHILHDFSANDTGELYAVCEYCKKFLNTKDLSRLLDIPEGTLRQWRSSGVGPKWHKLRGSVRYDREHVDLFIHESERSPSVRAITEDHLVSVSTAR